MTKLALCLLAALALPAALNAQQLAAEVDLPDAPIPQTVTTPLPADQSTSAPSQQTTQPQDAQQPETAAHRKARADAQIQQEVHQRIGGVLPAFNSVQSEEAIPLTSGQKFHLFFRGSIDPYQFAIAAVDAGIEEAQDQYTEYHWGFTGLARRYGAGFADTWDGNFWGNAVLPSLLHQDPRYYRLGHGRKWHRFFYSAATTVICHGDNGKLQPNVSNVLGNFIGGAISNLYYPASDRGVLLTLQRGTTTTAEGIVGAELIEFYPDYLAWRHRRHLQKLARQAAAAN